MRIQIFTFNPFQENTYVLYDDSKEAVIIDPGCYEKEERDELLSFIEHEQLRVVKLLNTHCHVDHVLGNNFIKEYFKVPFLIHPKDEATLRAVKVYAPGYGFVKYEEALPDEWLEEGKDISFGSTRLKVLFTPGHAPGHVVFYNEEQKVCIGGDVLFHRSVGRTDLPGGDHDTLIKSVHDKLFILPDDVRVFPGHGPDTTIGEEKKLNPFCAIQ